VSFDRAVMRGNIGLSRIACPGGGDPRPLLTAGCSKKSFNRAAATEGDGSELPRAADGPRPYFGSDRQRRGPVNYRRADGALGCKASGKQIKYHDGAAVKKGHAPCL